MILSEGIAQRSLLGFLDLSQSRLNRRIDAYLMAAPKPDLVLHLKVDPVVAVERQRRRTEKRGPDRFDTEEGELLRMMKLSDRLLTDVVDTLAVDYEITVLEIGTDVWDSTTRVIQDQVVPDIARLAG